MPGTKEMSGLLLRQCLKLDENIKPLLIVAFGKPDEEIILTDVVDGKTGYYRDENDRHYVPKRAVEDIIIR